MATHANKARRAPAAAPALPKYSERYAAGKALRDRVPREAHGNWKPPRNRQNPVKLVVASSKGRISALIPVRYGRMSVSPSAFYRGTALNMASDLAHTPNTGIRAQLCGDCHLMNFGGFATPERREIFDINDFDETLPGPWERDLKRLATSIVHAARANGFARADERHAALACARAYRIRIAEYSRMHALDVWYARIDMGAVLAWFSDAGSKARLKKRIARAEARTVAESDFPKMVDGSGGRFAIKDNPPLLAHDQVLNLAASHDNIIGAFEAYRATLADDRRVLLDRYRLTDFALKVGGVGSVGTFCAVALLMGEDDDPLFLQIKEAHASVLEPYAGKSVYASHGQRVVAGQRLMQAASDIFLGWIHVAAGLDGGERDFYVRQLRDWKGSADIDVMVPKGMTIYAEMCGWTLARAHARSGDAVAIAAYLGKGEAFDKAIAAFSVAYADRNESDYALMKDAVASGRLEARTGL